MGPNVKKHISDSPDEDNPDGPAFKIFHQAAKQDKIKRHAAGIMTYSDV